MPTLLEGFVSKARAMRKTVTVTIQRREPNRKTGKMATWNQSVLVHDKKMELDVGDRALIASSKPISTAKHFTLKKILSKANRGFGGGGRLDTMLLAGGQAPDERDKRQLRRQEMGKIKVWTGPGEPTMAWLEARRREEAGEVIEWPKEETTAKMKKREEARAEAAVVESEEGAVPPSSAQDSQSQREMSL